jgi:AcrR family transcriptional regulator
MKEAVQRQRKGPEQRRQAQRERILDAARAEFIRSGFNAASMATIAETAGISAGLIYRYFPSKNAIILAIIDEQLQIARQRIREVRSAHDFSAGLLEYFEAHDADFAQPMSAALFLEMSAEATRDGEIAGALGEFNRAIRDELAAWLLRSGEGLDSSRGDGAMRERALALQLVVDGLKVRMAVEPEVDRALLANALCLLLGSVALSGGSGASHE